MRNYKCKRFGVHEVKKGKYKGSLHISTKAYREFHGEMLYLEEYLNGRILPAEPEEVSMTRLLINLVNVLENEMEKIIKQYYEKNPSNKGSKLTSKIEQGFVSFKGKFEWMSKQKLIDVIQYRIMEDLRVLRNKHTHYRLSPKRPRFKYLGYPLMTKTSLRNIFVDCALLLQHLRKLSGNKTKWQIIPPGYADELNWGNLQNIYVENAKKRTKSESNNSIQRT